MGESRDSAPAAHRSTGTIRAEDISRTMLRVDDARLFGVCRWERAATEGGESTDDPTEPDVNHVLKGVEKAGRQSGYPEKSSECAPMNSASESVASAYDVAIDNRFAFRKGTYDVGISSLSISASATSRLRSLHLTRRKRAIYHDGRLLDRATRRPVRSARQGIRRGRRSHTHQGRLCDQERLRRHQA